MGYYRTSAARAATTGAPGAQSGEIDAALDAVTACAKGRSLSRRGFFASAIAAAGAAAFALTGCSASSDKDGPLATIIVGSDIYPPANYLDENGDPAGFDVDITTEAFRRMGYKPQFEVINWEDKNDLLAAGTIDCAAGCFSMTGREDEYRWAGPYMRSRQVVAVNPSSDIYTLADLEDKVVAVQTTTKPESIILNRLKEGLPQVSKVYSFADRSLLYPALSKGYVDAVAAHEESILQYEADYSVEYRILDESLLEVGLGVAFYKGDERGIAEKMDSVFEEMLADGTMEQIVSNYYENASEYVEVDGLVSE